MAERMTMRRLREVLKIVIELLAAIPSVVWGFIGYMVLNPLIIWATGAPIGINILNGGLILVTEHGWSDFMTHAAGLSPALVA